MPDNARPGDHGGGIVASVTQTGAAKDGQRINVDRRVAARLHVRVNGPVIPGLAVSSVRVDYPAPVLGLTHPDLTVTYRLTNTGNIRVHGRAVLRARGPFGLGLGISEDVEVPEMLPGAEVVQTRTVRRVFPAGWVTGQVSVNPESAEGRLPVAVRGDTVAAPPWLLLALIAGLAGAVVWRVRRRRRASVE